MEEGCGWWKERGSLWLSAGDVQHFSSQQIVIRVVGSLHISYNQFICTHYIEKAREQMLSKLNSSFHWALFATHIHPYKSTIGAQSEKNKHVVSPRLIMHLSQCWSQARIFVTVFPVHLLNSAYTWQIRQRRTLINVNTGYVQPKTARCICGNGLNMWWPCFPGG